MENGGNNGRGKRSPIPGEWLNQEHVSKPATAAEPAKPEDSTSNFEPSSPNLTSPNLMPAAAKPAPPLLSKRRFMEPVTDEPKIKTRTLRYHKLEPADWENANGDFDEDATTPSASGGSSTPLSDPVRRFFLQRITDFMRSPYGITAVAATLVATAAITAVKFWPYLRHKSAQLYKKIVG